MRKEELFKFLKTFGDGKPHQWFEVIHLGVIYLKITQTRFESLFKKFLSYSLVYRLYKTSNWKDDYYAITKKGDDFLRSEQLKRTDYREYKYYKDFDRTPESAEKISPIMDKIKQKRKA